MSLLRTLQHYLDTTKIFDFLAPLALRLYLAPVFWMAGLNKWVDIESTAAWFGNSDWGLGLPFPTLMAWSVASIELIGAVMLFVGFGVRWISIPLMITMIVAMLLVHWQHGWQAVADAKFCLFNCDDAEAAAERLDAARNLLQQHGHYDWLTEQGSIVLLNNGIEFGATYFVMLLVLFFIGAGRFFSADYWVDQKLKKLIS